MLFGSYWFELTLPRNLGAEGRRFESCRPDQPAPGGVNRRNGRQIRTMRAIVSGSANSGAWP